MRLNSPLDLHVTLEPFHKPFESMAAEVVMKTASAGLNLVMP